MGTLAPFCVRLAVGQYTAKNNFLTAVIQLGFNKLMVKIYPAILSAVIGPDHTKKGPSPPIKRSINRFGEEPSMHEVEPQRMVKILGKWRHFFSGFTVRAYTNSGMALPINSPTRGKVPVEPVRTSTTSGFEFFSLRRKPSTERPPLNTLNFNYVLDKLKFLEILLKSSVIQGQQHFSDILNILTIMYNVRDIEIFYFFDFNIKNNGKC